MSQRTLQSTRTFAGLLLYLLLMLGSSHDASAQYSEEEATEASDTTLIIDTTGYVGPLLDSTLPVDSVGVVTGNGSTGSMASGSFVDSVFFEGEMIRLTVRIADEVRRDTARLRAVLDSIQGTTQALIAMNLNLDPSAWQPTEADKRERQEMIERAQDFEFIYPQDITRVPVASIPLSAIGQALGLTEDVSPLITYRLERTRRITVIVYTVLDALEVNRLVDGTQRPGNYRFKWDFNDSNGRRALSGSYIVEVIADGTERLLRKRIVVP